jgi:glucosyl-dolichyl phosphate glucuronosyltransferase
MDSQPDVSIVIPTYNRSKLLRNAIRSVLRQDNRAITFEIIVVDNNSRDDTGAVVRSLMGEAVGKLQYVVEPKQGNSHARNTGVDYSKGEIVAFIDDDVIVEAGWLSALQEAFKGRDHVSFAGGKVLPRWDGSPPSWLTRYSTTARVKGPLLARIHRV